MIRFIQRDEVTHLQLFANIYKEIKKENYLRQEMFSGEFKRSVKLPKNTDAKTLKTKYENGILKVSIDKKIIKPTSKVIPIN
jgi:HSP20 family molecular chaperone IbpA